MKRWRIILLFYSGVKLQAAGFDTEPEDSFLFRPFNNRGVVLQNKPLHRSSVWKIVKRHARKSGLKIDRLDERGICVHSTRVTAITTSFEGGAKSEEIQQLVGHKDPVWCKNSSAIENPCQGINSIRP